MATQMAATTGARRHGDHAPEWVLASELAWARTVARDRKMTPAGRSGSTAIVTGLNQPWRPVQVMCGPPASMDN
jgi:hypothetical protein